MRVRPGIAMVAAFAFACVGDADAAGTDFDVVYKATLERDEKNLVAHETECGPDDVWELSSFKFDAGRRLEVELGPSTVVFGRKGTNVLWSVIVPKEPGKVTSKDGDESVTGVWFRFHPARVGDLFPAKTVVGRADPGAALAWARRVYGHRINDWCQAESAPVVPDRNWAQMTTDVATGQARFFILDLKGKNVTTFVSSFSKGAVPAPPRTPISKADALAAFDGAWAAFDTTYAKFGIRPEVDWDALKVKHRPAAENAKTTWDAAIAVAALVTPLRDLHVHVWCGEEYVPSYFRSRASNWNFDATQALLGAKVAETGRDVYWARSKDDIGYIDVTKLEDPGVVAAFDEALEKLATTWALVIDLRANGGGGEDLALQMAGRIVDEERVYSVNQYRKQGDASRLALGPKLERRCPPRGPWRYASPVVVLTGQKTMSSAESFALMLAVCPHVTSVGDRTCGSSANPRRMEFPGGIAVNVPTWNDMLPDGTPLEDAGAPPEVPVKGDLHAFDAKDPVMEAALALLRKAPKSARRPGRR